MQQGADKDSRDATSAVTSHLRITVAQQAAEHLLPSLPSGPELPRRHQRTAQKGADGSPGKPWT